MPWPRAWPQIDIPPRHDLRATKKTGSAFLNLHLLPAFNEQTAYSTLAADEDVVPPFRAGSAVY